MPEAAPAAGGPVRCATHPAVPARFFCESCGRRLCDDCVVEGSRLLLCPACGERALPCDPNGPASTRARRQRSRDAAHRPRSVFSYPFRGPGALMFVSCATALGGLIAVLTSAPLFLRILFVLPVFLVGSFGARYLQEIVLRSAEGDEELPVWPDLHEATEGAGVFFALVGTAALAVLPALAVRALGPEGAPVPLAAGALAGCLAWALWLPGWGAIACYSGLASAFRLDLHLRALGHAGSDGFALTAIGALIALAGGGLALTGLLAWGTLLGGLAAGPVCCYAVFTVGHLVGVFFLKHRTALDRIYLG